MSVAGSTVPNRGWSRPSWSCPSNKATAQQNAKGDQFRNKEKPLNVCFPTATYLASCGWYGAGEWDWQWHWHQSHQEQTHPTEARHQRPWFCRWTQMLEDQEYLRQRVHLLPYSSWWFAVPPNRQNQRWCHNERKVPTKVYLLRKVATWSEFFKLAIVQAAISYENNLAYPKQSAQSLALDLHQSLWIG